MEYLLPHSVIYNKQKFKGKKQTFLFTMLRQVVMCNVRCFAHPLFETNIITGRHSSRVNRFSCLDVKDESDELEVGKLRLEEISRRIDSTSEKKVVQRKPKPLLATQACIEISSCVYSATYEDAFIREEACFTSEAITDTGDYYPSKTEAADREIPKEWELPDYSKEADPRNSRMDECPASEPSSDFGKCSQDEWNTFEDDELPPSLP